MTHKQIASHALFSSRLFYQMLIGAGIALLFIGVFLLGAETNPGWSQYWMIRPFLIVPVAGALGGAFFYFMGNLRSQRG